MGVSIVGLGNRSARGKDVRRETLNLLGFNGGRNRPAGEVSDKTNKSSPLNLWGLLIAADSTRKFCSELRQKTKGYVSRSPVDRGLNLEILWWNWGRIPAYPTARKDSKAARVDWVPILFLASRLVESCE